MRRLLPLIVLAATAGSAAADEAPLAGWRITPHPDRGTCMAVQDQVQATSYGFIADHDSVALTLAGADWTVKDAGYQLRLQIDGQPPVTLPAQGGGRSYALPLSEAMERQIEGSTELHITIDGKDLVLHPTGLKPVIDTVRRCAEALPPAMLLENPPQQIDPLARP